MSKRLEILQHALGVDEYGRGEQYRSHYVVGAGCPNHAECMAMVAEGLMTRRDGASIPFGGNDLFHATEAGRAFVADNSPNPPRLTASQRRYQAWLDGPADWMSFGEYLRRSARSSAC